MSNPTRFSLLLNLKFCLLMTEIRKTIILILSFGFSGIFLSSCKEKYSEGMIVFTQVAEKITDINPVAGNFTRQNAQTLIVALNPGSPDSPIKVLSEGFYSACSPAISYDGARMLFAAKQKQDDPWQIWKMDLKKSEIKQITSLPENCIGPSFLPNGRLIFSKMALNDSTNTGNALYSCNADGSDIRQLTFNPHSYSASTILKDGRVLTIRRQLCPDSNEALFMVLRPDGTKNEMFYKGSEKFQPVSRGWETTTGRIVFIESDKESHESGKLISVSYNRPLHSYNDLSSGIEGNFISVYPLISGKLLVSYRRSESDRYGLYEFDPENKTLGRAVYESKEYDVAEAVAIEQHNRQKKLPSEVDTGVKSGLILCQDINFSGLIPAGDASALPKATRIRIIGRDSSLGEIDVEKDGSFYLKVKADTPFRIQALDEKGSVMGYPCGWIYLRQNERRGCVGCHEDPEIVPDNKVSLAVKKAPVNVPVHISKVVEKKVSLE